jgi:23S rRNA (cytosine1962-C5)-methyltransferase
MSETHPIVLVTKPSAGYELLDSGNGEKLERFGAFILRRPDPQALWSKAQPDIWSTAQAEFVHAGRSGTWRQHSPVPETWTAELAGLTFDVSLSAFKHTGIFPEQSENWLWIMETIDRARKADPARTVSVLNLFGYTGGATLAAAKAGAQVTHVDASKVSVKRASDNAEKSGLANTSVRWIVDDALEFVKREVRRGNHYDAIVMDPPTYGHGPKKELWQIETHLPELIAECRKLLSDKPLFVILNGYASGYSAIAYKNNVEELVCGVTVSAKDGIVAGELQYGELATATQAGRELPSGIFARWRAGV